ncbi:hypothetical protein D3C87_1549270 [compost metagenome]
MIASAGGHALQLGRGEDFPSQAFGAFGVEQVFQVHAQPAPMAFFRDDGRCPTGAVGDRTGDVRRPDGRPVLADGRAEAQTFELLQGGTGADSPGEKLCLPLGDGALDARWRLDGAALEVIAEQLRRIEVGTEQHRIWQRNR